MNLPTCAKPATAEWCSEPAAITRPARFSSGARACRAFTLNELLIVLVLAVLLALVMLPWLASRRIPRQPITCVNNLKQISLSFLLWAGDNGGPNDAFPMQVSTNQGGAQEPAARGEVFRIFQVLSNELNTPKILVCPQDTRPAAVNFSALSNGNLSYFVNLDAGGSNAPIILAGDRNLASAVGPLLPGIHPVPTTVPLGWTRALHGARGHVALADGSVQACARIPAAPVTGTNSAATNHFAIP